MPQVHPSAILEGQVELADDVVVGPHCVLNGPITIGPGGRLVGHVYVQGPLTMGSGNIVYPFTCLGFAPQHLKFDPQRPGRGTVIGDRNTFREQVTVHRAFTDDGPTTIGHRNLFMVGSHVGHDCQVGHDCVVVNGAMLGGHVTVGDRVTLGGISGVHQFCRVGRGAMLSGGVVSSADIPPFFMLTGFNVCGALNLIGMRRSGMSRAEIDEVRWVYRTLYREGLAMASAIDVLRTRADRPLVAEFIEFLATSKRGICAGRGSAIRGRAVEVVIEGLRDEVEHAGG